MAREFDERNMARNRERCAAMAERAGMGRRALSERERQILEMWPRFEDGELVMVGDRVGHPVEKVGSITILESAFVLCDDAASSAQYERGQRVKRPAPEVLDADGVEIKVGDTVYDVRGERFTVTDIDGDLLGLSQDGFIIGSMMPADQFSISLRDSWEQLEEDIAKYPCRYAEEVKGSKFNSCSECPWHSEVMARDLVRRAKALAGVEVGE